MTINQMRCEDYLENSYWNNKGKHQNEYNEIMAAVDAGTFELTKATQKVFHSYYRFHNDGDTPTSYRYYAEKYQEIIEEKANERILAEYKRFKKANKEENTMAKKEMTREEKLWTMTGTTLLGVAENLGLNVNKNTLKQGKEKLIAKILEAEKKLENGANNEQMEAPEAVVPAVEEKPKRRRGKNKASEEVAGDGTPYKQVMNEILEDEKKAAKKKAESKAPKAPKKDPKKTNLKMNELTYKGKTKTVREWANELGMPWATLYDRVNRNGWTVEDAIEIPLGERRPR